MVAPLAFSLFFNPDAFVAVSFPDRILKVAVIIYLAALVLRVGFRAVFRVGFFTMFIHLKVLCMNL